jgi:hypothetical protein
MDARKFDMMALESEFRFNKMLEEFERQWEGDRAQWQQTNMSSREAIPGRQLPGNSELMQANLPTGMETSAGSPLE